MATLQVAHTIVLRCRWCSHPAGEISPYPGAALAYFWSCSNRKCGMRNEVTVQAR